MNISKKPRTFVQDDLFDFSGLEKKKADQKEEVKKSEKLVIEKKPVKTFSTPADDNMGGFF